MNPSSLTLTGVSAVAILGAAGPLTTAFRRSGRLEPPEPRTTSGKGPRGVSAVSIILDDVNDWVRFE